MVWVEEQGHKRLWRRAATRWICFRFLDLQRALLSTVTLVADNIWFFSL